MSVYGSTYAASTPTTTINQLKFSVVTQTTETSFTPPLTSQFNANTLETSFASGVSSLTETPTQNLIISSDCENLVYLAMWLHMNTARPATYNLLNGDCCVAEGITCTDEKVTSIEWGSMGLNGQIIGAYLPTALQYLRLDRNSLTGGIPGNLPVGLIYLNLSGNDRLTGNIPATLPSGLEVLLLDGNQFEGDLPDFPSSLKTLYLGSPDYQGNKFSGTLRLNKPTELFINNNLITNIIVQNISALTSCDLSFNPLQGAPIISDLTMCTKTGLYQLIETSSNNRVSSTTRSSTTRLIQFTQIPTRNSTTTISRLPSRVTGSSTKTSSIEQMRFNVTNQTSGLKSTTFYNFTMGGNKTSYSLNKNKTLEINRTQSAIYSSTLTFMKWSVENYTAPTASATQTSLISSSDCLKMIQFALGLGMNTSQPSIWSSLQGNCCLATGVSCTNKRVTSVKWGDLQLYGGVIDGNSIPVGVQYLWLFQNLLVGNIPTNLPPGLISMNLGDNRLTGSIPNLPANLTELYLDGNRLTGDLPTFPLPIWIIYLGSPMNIGNRLSGTLSLYRPREVYITDNLITNVNIQDISLIDPSNCDLSSNPLLGNPNITGLSMCTQNKLFNIAFSSDLFVLNQTNSLRNHYGTLNETKKVDVTKTNIFTSTIVTTRSLVTTTMVAQSPSPTPIPPTNSNTYFAFGFGIPGALISLGISFKIVIKVRNRRRKNQKEMVKFNLYRSISKLRSPELIVNQEWRTVKSWNWRPGMR